jgi:CheY-like chemotaxis protein
LTSSPLVVVVVVDDDDDLRDSLQDLLEAHGFIVATARNGRDALALLARTANAGLILLDLVMPEMDGWAFLEERGRRPELAQIPVIITTSAPERAPAGYLVLGKPIDVPFFLEQVRRYCG